jgi:hypothetical protein
MCDLPDRNSRISPSKIFLPFLSVSPVNWPTVSGITSDFDVVIGRGKM